MRIESTADGRRKMEIGLEKDTRRRARVGIGRSLESRKVIEIDARKAKGQGTETAMKMKRGEEEGEEKEGVIRKEGTGSLKRMTIMLAIVNPGAIDIGKDSESDPDPDSGSGSQPYAYSERARDSYKVRRRHRLDDRRERFR